MVNHTSATYESFLSIYFPIGSDLYSLFLEEVSLLILWELWGDLSLICTIQNKCFSADAIVNLSQNSESKNNKAFKVFSQNTLKRVLYSQFIGGEFSTHTLRALGSFIYSYATRLEDIWTKKRHQKRGEGSTHTLRAVRRFITYILFQIKYFMLHCREAGSSPDLRSIRGGIKLKRHSTSSQEGN